MKLSRLLTGTVLAAGLLAAGAAPAHAIDLVELKTLGEGHFDCAAEWCYVCVDVSPAAVRGQDDICIL